MTKTIKAIKVTELINKAIKAIKVINKVMEVTEAISVMAFYKDTF